MKKRDNLVPEWHLEDAIAKALLAWEVYDKSMNRNPSDDSIPVLRGELIKAIAEVLKKAKGI